MKDKKIILPIVASFVLGFGASQILGQSGVKVEVVKYTPTEEISITNEDHDEYNEFDIYDNEGEYIRVAPVKAIKGEGYFILTDLHGEIHVERDMELQDGQNYMAFINKEDNKLQSVLESSFKFSYESEFEDEEFIQEELDAAKELEERKTSEKMIIL